MALCVYILFVVDRFIKLGFFVAPDEFQELLSWLPYEQYMYLNDGVIFGWQLPAWLIIVLSASLLIVVLLNLLQYLYQLRSVEYFGWMLIFVGGLSNVLDRFRFGSVIDWWQMPWGAVINLSDVYILIGICIVIYKTAREQ